MPIFSIEQREQWQTLVTYSIEAKNEDEAQVLTRTGTFQYENHQILNRDFVKILEIHETQIH
jgi:hypothetical protein